MVVENRTAHSEKETREPREVSLMYRSNREVLFRFYSENCVLIRLRSTPGLLSKNVSMSSGLIQYTTASSMTFIWLVGVGFGSPSTR